MKKGDKDMAQRKEKPTTNQLSMMLIEKRHALKLTQKDVADQIRYIAIIIFKDRTW